MILKHIDRNVSSLWSSAFFGVFLKFFLWYLIAKHSSNWNLSSIFTLYVLKIPKTGIITLIIYYSSDKFISNCKIKSRVFFFIFFTFLYLKKLLIHELCLWKTDKYESKILVQYFQANCPSMPSLAFLSLQKISANNIYKL